MLAVLVVVPGSAPAATVEVVEQPSAEVVFLGEGDEANDVRYSVEEGGRVAVLRDNYAVVRPGRGCTAIDEHAARCATGGGGVLPVRIEVGGGGDIVTTSPFSPEGVPVLLASGGPGDDFLFGNSARTNVLDGGPGVDRVIGGSGNDTLVGGPGADVVRAGPGDDVLVDDPVGGPYANDQLDGGDGFDRVSYASRQVPLAVDLSVLGGDGAAGENDSVEEVEAVEGGLASDVLIGSDAGNELGGGGGADRIFGGAGDDVVRAGGATADPGDRVACGAGSDRVGAVDVRDVVLADCERVEVLGLWVGRVRRSRRGFIVALAPGERPVSCRVSVTVTSSRRAFRSSPVRVRRPVRVAVRRAARVRRPPAGRRLRVEMRGTGCGGAGGFALEP